MRKTPVENTDDEGSDRFGNQDKRGDRFYDDAIGADRETSAFAWSELADEHPFFEELTWMLDTHGLRDARALEIGAGRGAFQSEVADYTAIDLAASAKQWLYKPFARADATALPFGDDAFDVVWSNYVLEHVADPEAMLSEVARVLRPGGYFLMSARWQAGPWLSEGYPVRPYSDFNLRGKLIKASIPARSSLLYRLVRLAPRRLGRAVKLAIRRQPTRLHHRELTPNFKNNWMPDATAATSVEPYEVYCWYVSRGFRCANYPSLLKGLAIRTGALVFQAPQPE